MNLSKLFLLLILLLSLTLAKAQEHPDFEIIKQTETTVVKDQGRSGTCWSYAALSFFESELLREKSLEVNLSEMFPVYYAYISKAKYYLQLHGKANFSQGGQAHDVINEMRVYGLMPESAYNGLISNSTKHNHSKLEKELKNCLDSILELETVQLSWEYNVVDILNKHIGAPPDTFEYAQKEYTAKTFSSEFLELNPDDYVELTSFLHHPYYEQIDLEVPDNWSHDNYYNLPIDEFMQVMEYAITNGYSICWDGDVSEKDFDYKKGKATLTESDLFFIKKKRMQEARQITFDNHITTDDHLMHVTGIAKDKTGKKYYITKNSWGDANKFDGYLYMSEDYVALKTIAILIHKDAIPKKIKKKLKI